MDPPHSGLSCAALCRAGGRTVDLRPLSGLLGVRTGGADSPGRSCIYWEWLCARQLTHIISNPHRDLAGDAIITPRMTNRTLENLVIRQLPKVTETSTVTPPVVPLS